MTLQRATAADEYGNPASDWTAPTSTPAKAFVMVGSRTARGEAALSVKALFPVGTDVQEGDRLLWAGATYEVEAPRTLRSPSRSILMAAGLRLLAA